MKAERYGERFLEAIAGYLQGNKVSETALEPSRNYDPSAVEISDQPVTVSIIADRINCELMESGHNNISGKRINDWLISNDYLTIVAENGKSIKVPTPKGEALGIICEERSVRGEQMKINIFSREAQEAIIANSVQLLNDR